MEVTSILSDYDGTLCATSYVRGQTSTIPERLEYVLRSISRKVPVCLVSSKDFSFLQSRARFARIISCIMGIETIELPTDNNSKYKVKTSGPRIYPNRDILRDNSDLLEYLAQEAKERFKEIIVERKYTDDKLLAGLTFDYRHLKNWERYKLDVEPVLHEMIDDRIKQSTPSSATTAFSPYIQSYSSHPFIDVYSVKCDKGRAVDTIVSMLETLRIDVEQRQNNMMYLGDSENDNPAFRKAGISIGVRSDPRLNPTLEADYSISFDRLSSFLERLLNNDFVFSSDMIAGLA
jgi:HAD superfamily hydrolase (TIGR01484 family)